MPITSFVDVQVALGPATTPEPAFGTSCLLGNLSSFQFNEFSKLTSGLSTLLIGINEHTDVLDSLGIPLGSDVYEQVTAHFTGFRKPNEMLLTYRGRDALDHDQRVIVLEDQLGSGRAFPGLYRVDAEGGPYSYESLGVPQVIDATIGDVGAGVATTGLYTVSDGEGNNFQHTSGAKQFWTLTVVNAGANTYSIDIDGTVYSALALGSDSISQVRDKLLADLVSITAHPVHPNWVATTSGAADIVVNTQEFGVAVLATTPLPVGDLTATETVEATQTVIAVVAALVALIGTPVTYTVVDASPAITFTANLPGVDLGIQVSGRTTGSGIAVGGAVTQVTTTDHRETVTVVRDALGVALTAGGHPSFTNADLGTDSIDLEGAVAGAFVEVAVLGPNSASIALTEVQGILEKNIAQTSRITVVPLTGTTAEDGIYSILIFGVPISFNAVSQTITQVRDTLQAAVIANVPQVTATTTIGIDAFDITNNTAGQPFSMVLASPSSNQRMTQAIITAVYGIGTDVQRAFDDSGDWYFLLNGFSDPLSIVEAGRAVEGLVPGRSHIAQTSDLSNRDVQLAAALPTADVGAELSILQFQRTALFFHAPQDGAQAYKAPFSQWVGTYETLLPGQINTHGVQMRGFQARRVTNQQDANLRARNATYLDNFPALGQSQASNGGKNTNGRKFDLIRGADQATALLQIGILNLMIPRAILVYSPSGVKEVDAVIAEAFDDLVDQGFAIANSLETNQVDISTATALQAQDGVMPEFIITFVAQAGTDVVKVRGTITQQAGTEAAAIAA